MRYQKVIRHGTSLAVVIPAAVAREIDVHRGDVVVLSVLHKKVGGAPTNALYIEIEPVVNREIQANVQKDGRGNTKNSTRQH